MTAPRAIVLLSGGLDSATTLAIAKSRGFECYALTVAYGQRHMVEIEAAVRVASTLGAREHKIMDVNLADIGGSALTDLSLKVPEAPTQGIPVTYVPARNTIMLALALAWAEVVEASAVLIGVNAVDYSVAGDTRVWVRTRCGARLAKIADVVALPPDEYETLGVDLESLKPIWKRILGRYRHHVGSKKCFKLRLERGQQIEVTEDHSLFTIENNTIVTVRGAEIKVGTPLVAPFDLSANASCWMSELQFIDLTLLRREKDSAYRKSSVVEVSGFLTNRLRRTTVPLRFHLTDDFLRIVGLWLAEGGKEQDGRSRTLAFSIGGLEGAPELLRRYFSDYGASVRKSPKNEFDFRVDSSVFYEVFRRLDLLSTAKSGRKRFPAWFWDLSQRQRRIVVAGLWDGDGCRVWKGEAPIFQKSHELIDELYHCLQLDGIFPTIRQAAHGQLRLALTRTVDLARFESLYPLWHRGKRESLRQAGLESGRDKTTGIWKSEALWAEVAAAALPAGFKTGIYNRGGKYDASVRAQRSAFAPVPNLDRLRNSRLAFLRVVEIQPVAHEFMYDLAVEDCQNFLANGFLAHNSGYPDCRPEFIEAFGELARRATKAAVEGNPCRIEAPLINWTKEQIIREGTRLGVDFGLTVSCYQADREGRACRLCDSCRLRAAGFAASGLLDPTRYQPMDGPPR
jgi:7-cyano-7-deazaguanine synthase in queuosine biosynthesis/intein/homing endonuclease